MSISHKIKGKFALNIRIASKIIRVGLFAFEDKGALNDLSMGECFLEHTQTAERNN